MKHTAPQRGSWAQYGALPPTWMRGTLARAAFTAEAPGCRTGYVSTPIDLSDVDPAFARALRRIRRSTVITVPARSSLAAPIVLTAAAQGGRAAGITVISVGAGARVVVDERFLFAGAHTNDAAFATIVKIGAGATVIWRTTLEGGSGLAGVHFRSATLGEGATLHADLAATLEGRWWSQSRIFLPKARAHAEGGSAIRINGSGVLIHDVLHDVRGASCTTEQRERAVVDGLGRSASELRIHLGTRATQASSYQSHKALLLSEGAMARAVPSLEIETDDVRCGHGSTTARLDSAQRHYLASRGLPPDEATRVLVDAFLVTARLMPLDPTPLPAAA